MPLHTATAAAYDERPWTATVSWGAVFAGLVLSLIVYLVLSVLGTAIGASAIDPMGDRNPFSGFGVGAGVWAGVTTLLAIAVGGFVAGFLARRSGGLHGLLAWAMTTLVTVYLLISATGSALNVAGSAAKTGLTTVGAVAGAGVSAAAPAVGGAVQRQLDQAGISLDVSGKQTLTLVVTDGGDGATCDHADWAGARLTKASNGRVAATVQPEAGSFTAEVYPNPTRDMLKVRYWAETTGDLSLQLLNQGGQPMIKQVYAVPAGENLISVPVQELPRGFYILSLIQGQQRVTSKVILAE